MYVCICNAVTDRDILNAVDNGARSLDDLGEMLKVATCCGRCADTANHLLTQAREHTVTVNLTMPEILAGAAA